MNLIIWLAIGYLIMGVTNFILTKTVWKDVSNFYSFLYVLLSPLTLPYTLGELLSEKVIMKEQARLMTVRKNGHVITFENFDQYSFFASYMANRIIEEKTANGEHVEEVEKISMEELRDYDLWVKYIDELRLSDDIILLEGDGYTVCKLLTMEEKRRYLTQKEESKNTTSEK